MPSARTWVSISAAVDCCSVRTATGNPRVFGRPHSGAHSLVDGGPLRNAILDVEGTNLREELTINVAARDAELVVNEIPSILWSLAQLLSTAGRGLTPGEILPYSGPVFERFAFETLYSSDISYLTLESRIISSTGPPTVLVCLYPIYREERKAAAELGRVAFEQHLGDHDIDLTNLRRPPITF